MENHGLFKVGQDIMLFNSNSEALIIEHPSGKWLLPGGRMEVGEEAEEGLRREVKEEVGIENFTLKGIHSVRTWEDPVPHVGIYYIGEVADGVEVVIDNEEVSNFAWVNAETIEDYTFWGEGIKRDLKELLLDNTN